MMYSVKVGSERFRARHMKGVLGATLLGLFLILAIGATNADAVVLNERLLAKTHEHLPLQITTGAGPGSRRSVDVPALEALSHDRRAGGHPDGTVSFAFDNTGSYARDVTVDLPAGFLGNPEAVSICSRERLAQNSCPASSQVGVISLNFSNSPRASQGLFRVTRAAHSPATFGFTFGSQMIILNARLRSDGDYGISIDSRDISAVPFIVNEIVATLWGVPGAEINDSDRWNSRTGDWVAQSGTGLRPFVLSPPRCNYASDLETTLSIRSWQNPSVWLPQDLSDGDLRRDLYRAESPVPVGCELLPTFSPTLDMGPADHRAGQPAGYRAVLAQSFNEDPNGRIGAYLRKVEVELPEGLTVSPPAADGLVGCTDAQAGFGTQSVAACPQAAKIGQVDVVTPLLPEPLKGDVFLGTPTDEQLLRVFIILKGFGVVVRVAGDIHADPSTGQLRAVFDDNPQLPFTEMTLRFDGGAKASLVNPMKCGSHQVTTKMTSWNDDVHVSTSTFLIDADAHGGACRSNAPFAPWLDANTVNGLSGEYSEFFTRFGRDDADAQIDSLSVELPQGLAAKIAGIPRCESARADAGTCGPESRVGHVQAAAGAGPQPFWVPGPGKDATSVSLAGPYRGAPFSLSIVVPAQAGPFDLGRVVVRAPISIDMRTAQVSVDVAESRWYNRFGHLQQVLQGKMPTILEGIPLRLKETRVIMDRDDFMVNPTSCRMQAVAARIGAVDGRVADVSSPFRATDCAELGFQPRFAMRILDRSRRSTMRSWNPRTRFVVRPRAGDANLGPTMVTLPSSVILDQGNIRTVCTRVQFAERNCPRQAIYGYAKAWSPLLDEPVEGPVYLQANGGARPLPDLMADLDGQVRIALEGWIDTVRRGRTGRLRNRFMVVPDVPVTRFQLTMRGGRNRGLLVNSTDLCRTNERGVARFRGANGKLSVQRPAIMTAFRGCKRARRQAARRAAKRKIAKRSAARRSTLRNRIGGVARGSGVTKGS